MLDADNLDPTAVEPMLAASLRGWRHARAAPIRHGARTDRA
ncbi:hypothetical protein ACW9HQ_30040 [Nocardia gipuzkoensis]